MDTMETLPMDIGMDAAAPIHDVAANPEILAGDGDGKGDNDETADPKYPKASCEEPVNVKKPAEDLPPRPAALDDLKPIGPVEQRELKPKKRIRGKKAPEPKEKAAPKRRGRKPKSEAPDPEPVEPAEPAAEPKPKAKSRDKKTAEAETDCEKGSKSKTSAGKRGRGKRVADHDDGAPAGPPASGSSMPTEESGPPGTSDSVATAVVAAESSGSNGSEAAAETIETAEITDGGAVAADAASTSGDVDPKEERKRKASRKSSAYHVAKKRALGEGKTMEEATVIAKQVSLVLILYIFHFPSMIPPPNSHLFGQDIYPQETYVADSGLQEHFVNPWQISMAKLHVWLCRSRSFVSLLGLACKACIWLWWHHWGWQLPWATSLDLWTRSAVGTAPCTSFVRNKSKHVMCGSASLVHASLLKLYMLKFPILLYIQVLNACSCKVWTSLSSQSISILDFTKNLTGPSTDWQVICLGELIGCARRSSLATTACLVSKGWFVAMSSIAISCMHLSHAWLPFFRFTSFWLHACISQCEGYSVNYSCWGAPSHGLLTGVQFATCSSSKGGRPMRM